jgi:serine/threonine-protein kinase
MYEILADARPRLDETKPDVPPGLGEIVGRAFARKREDRFQNAGEALAALEEELERLGPGPSLESRAWVDELLDRVSAPPPAAAALPTAPARPGQDTTTHGAVSVSLRPDVDGAPPASPVSPAASTSDGRSPGFVSASTERRRTPLAMGVALGGLVGVAAIVGAVVVAEKTPTANPPTASAAPLPAPSSGPTPSAADTAPAVAPSSLVTATAVDASTRTRTVEARPAGGLSPAAAASGPARGPGRATPAKRPADTDPFRGVTGTGL